MSADKDQEIRCICSRLLAKRTAAGIELKCSRCRHYTAIALEDLSEEEREIRFTPSGDDDR